jgi:hypothetical protein
MGEQHHGVTPGTSGEPSWANVAVTTLRLWLHRHTPQRHTQRGRRPTSRGQRGMLVLSAVAAMALGALVTLVFTDRGDQAQNASSVQTAGPAPSTPSPLQTAAANRSQAATWIAQQVLPSVLIGCDPLMCGALESAGVSASRLSQVQPTAPDPLGVEVVVATPALRSQFGSRLATVYAPLVLASFGSGAQRIDIRYLVPGGAAPFDASLAPDRHARIDLAGLPGRAALLAGNVDPRLLVTLSLLAHEMPVQLLLFDDPSPGASAEVPLRGAEIGSSASAGLSAMFAFLAQQTTYQPSRYRETRTASGQVITVQYDAPGPLGMSGP